MAITCQILAVKKPANITATNMTMTTYDCDEPCTSDVTITWQNIGGRAKNFEPAILVNGIRTGLGSNVNLSPAQTYQHTFSVTGLMEGNYTICPDPN